MKTIKSKIFRSGNRGFSLVELSVATGIVMVSLVAAGNIVNLIYSSNNHLDSMSKQNTVKANFVAQLVTESNWKATYSEASNMNDNKMQCLYDHTDCSALIGAPQSFHILDSKLKPVYDPLSPSTGTIPNGFSTTGATCTSYGSTAGTDACPYHYDLTWEPICKAGSCTDPLVKIHGQFHVNFASQVVGRINSTDYLPMNFDLIMNMKPRANLYAYPVTFYVNWNTDPGPYTPFTFSIPHSPIANAEGAITLLNATKGNPGSVVTWSGNTISYTPKLKFYGIDFVEYEFKDEIGNKGKGRAWMKVVTPFTWVGDGSDKRASSKANWCGTVSADGLCMHDLDPTVGNPFAHLVFNNNCNNLCSDIDLDIPRIEGLEIMSSFHGKITQSKNVLIETQPLDWNPMTKNYVHQGFYQGGGTYDTNGFDLRNQTDYPIAWNPWTDPVPAPQNDQGIIWDGTGARPAQSNFYLAGGKFVISAGNNVTGYNSGMQIASGVDFQNNGTLTTQHYWASLAYFGAGAGIDLGTLNVDSHSAGSPTYTGENLTVKNLNLDGAGNAEGGICGVKPVELSVSGSVTAVGIGGVSYCGDSVKLNLKIKLDDSAPHNVIGSTDPAIPGAVPNLVTSAVQPTHFSKNLILAGDTNLQGTTDFAVGSRVNLVNGSLAATTAPVFYDAGFMGGDYYVLNTPMNVEHDFTIDRCASRLNDGTGCSGYRLATWDEAANQIKLKGDLYLVSGMMDIASDKIVVIDFVGTGDQSILGKNSSGMVGLPSVAVHKLSGIFAIKQVAAGGSMQFMGSLDIVAADSVPQFIGTKFYLGNYQMYPSDWRTFSSALGPLDFGSADLTVVGGSFDLKGKTLMAASLSQHYGFGGPGAVHGLIQISGDVNVPEYSGGNAVLEFVGGRTHNYTGYHDAAPWISPKHNLLVDNGETVIFNNASTDFDTVTISGGTFDQHSQYLKCTSVAGTTGTWMTGGPAPINFTGTNNFTGTIR